ncbi:MAG: polyprenyl synthetase family protein [Bacteriovoracaceae bacterium]|nr:polyprenyl synthetase family protein [Bacteriovoracaceae bacterium]
MPTEEMKKKFNTFFKEEMTSFYPEDHTLFRAIRYALFASGKRVRPLLTCASAKMTGAKLEMAYVSGVAVEMIHTYSLIHDDLPGMDNDDLRRGKPTTHRMFGEGMAILAGDALVTDAPLYFVSKMNELGCKPELINEMLIEILKSSGTSGMVFGQSLDIINDSNKVGAATGQRDEAQKLELLKKIHYNKTGRLICLAMKLGAMGRTDSRIDQQLLNKVEELGDLIGLSFQVTDDVLDIISTSDKLGKTANKDSQQGKLTYPSIWGVEKSQKYACELLDKSVALIDEVSLAGEGEELRQIITALRNRVN